MRLSRVLCPLSLVAVIATDAFAQNPPSGAPPPTQPQRGGRGRAIRVMTVTSSAFKDGGMLATKYTQAGEEVSPPLAWSGVPDSTRSLVLIMRDLDAPSGRDGTDDLLHWMLWNIPGTTMSLPESMPAQSQLSDGTRQISVSGPYYRGPGAPASGPPHHYVFEIFALDTLLEVPALGASPAATRAAVLGAMVGRVRAKGVLVALYKR